MWDLKRFSDRPAVTDDRGGGLTYEQLDAACRGLSSAVGGRCLVFSMCDNRLGSLVGYVSFLNGRIVPVMLKRSLDGELLAALWRDYRPAYIWLPEEDVPALPVREGCEAVYGAFGYTLLKTPFGADTPLYDELALLLTTSGSTGSPKLVRQSYENLQANTRSIAEYLHLDESERPITTLPMNYTYGLSILNTHLYAGAHILLTDKSLMQREFWSFFRDGEATSFGGVPYTYEMLKRLRFFRMELPSLRTMTQAGGRLLPELHREFAQYAHDTGREFVVMYGQSEATARMAWLPPARSLDKVGSMGIPIPGGRFELLDADGSIITEPGKTGELVYYGKNVTLGYAACAEDLAKGDENGGRLATGDMAQADDEGFYTIVGRKKRFLKIFGNRVNLDDAERLIRGGFEIDAVCGGRDDRLYILFTADAALAPELRRWLAEKTGLPAAAIRAVHIDSIPHNEAGKVLYSALEAYYDE